MIRREPFLDPAKRWWKKAGVNAPFIHYSLPFGMDSLLVLDADVVKEVLFANYGERPRFAKRLNALIPIVGNGLVTLEGRDWQRHRRIIHPSFQPSLIRESLGDFVPKIMSRFISLWEKADGREIDVNTHLSNLTLDIIGEVAFSHSFNALESIERWVDQGDDNYDMLDLDDKVMKAMAEMLQNTARRILLKILNLSILDFSTARTRKAMDEAVDEVITEARRKLKSNQNNNNCHDATSHEGGGTKPLHGEQHSRISLLQRLLDAENSDAKKNARKSLGRHELRDETKTFLMAGHETTSTWCYWAFFALCKHPDVQEKVFRDINEHSPEGKTSDILMKSIEKMPYFNAFMKEVLRLYPPAGMIIRYTTKEENLKGVTIPPLTRLVIPIHLLHRHPNYWKDPEEFHPERWMGEAHPSSHKHAFMPFSKGPRNCIGYYFAEMEAKMLMAPLIRRFSFRLAPSIRNSDFTFSLFITMKTKPGLKIVARNRK
jgi:cytochrome P450